VFFCSSGTVDQVIKPKVICLYVFRPYFSAANATTPFPPQIEFSLDILPQAGSFVPRHHMG
jgi:hypothetical protein